MNMFKREPSKLKIVDNRTLSYLQGFVDDRDEDEHSFKLALQRQIKENIKKTRSKRKQYD